MAGNVGPVTLSPPEGRAGLRAELPPCERLWPVPSVSAERCLRGKGGGEEARAKRIASVCHLASSGKSNNST